MRRQRDAHMTGAPPDDEPARPRRASPTVTSTSITDAVGGARGLLDSGLSAVVFVAVNAVAGLRTGIIAAVAVGVALIALRLLRHEPLRQAVSGFFGLALAAGVAGYTHSAVGFFLPGIIYQAVLAVAAVVSLVIGRPYVGYLAATFDEKLTGWRDDPRMRRAMAWATLLWAGVFALRTVVQGFLYLTHHPGWLAATKLGMGWPLFAGALAITYGLIRRAERFGADGTGAPGGPGAADGAVGAPTSPAAAGVDAVAGSEHDRS